MVDHPRVDGASLHPTREQLRDLILGIEMDETLARDLEQHLGECQSCEKLASESVDDPLTTLVRQAIESGGYPKSTDVITKTKLSQGYVLVEEIGRGASGIVYKALHPGLDRFVAMKILVSGTNAAPAEIARFKRESEALARLDHPNIVRVFDVGEQEGAPYLAMECVEGQTLSQILNGRSMAPIASARIAFGLANGIAHAHKNDVIHRDLKPQNILCAIEYAKEGEEDLTDSNSDWNGRTEWQTQGSIETGTFKICDFGLARFGDGVGLRTQTGATLGTPSYMAPEQIHAKPDQIGESADIYGLGAILYECLTGRPPFHGNSPLETIKLVADSEPVRVELLSPRVPRDLAIICHRCLSKNVAARFPSAAELAEDLNRFLVGQPIKSRSVSKLERFGRWAKCNPWPVAVAILFMALVVSIIIGQWSYQSRLTRERDDAITNYQIARGTVWEMLDATSRESDLDIPRLQELRTAQTESALSLFESLAKDDNTRQAKMDLANIQMKYGTGLVAHGKFVEGQEILFAAQNNFRLLIREYPENVEAISGLIANQVKMAYSMTESDKTQEAIHVLENALAMADDLYHNEPLVVANGKLLAWTLHNLGTAQVANQQHELARQSFQSAVDLLQVARESEPENDELLRYLSESQISLGMCEMNAGLVEAAETYQKAINSLNEIRKRNPKNTEAMISVAVAQLNRSNILNGQSKTQAAIDACSEGIELIEKVLAVAPNQHKSKAYISMLYGNRAIFKSNDHRADAAIDDWRSAIQHSVDNSTRDFCRVYLIRDLAGESRIVEAIEDAEHVQIDQLDDSMKFELATSWATVCNAIDKTQIAPRLPNGKLKRQSELCVENIKSIFLILAETNFFESDTRAKDHVRSHEDFKSFRALTSSDALECLFEK